MAAAASTTAIGSGRIRVSPASAMATSIARRMAASGNRESVRELENAGVTGSSAVKKAVSDGSNCSAGSTASSWRRVFSSEPKRALEAKLFHAVVVLIRRANSSASGASVRPSR